MRVGRTEFDSRQGRNFFFATASALALGPTHHPYSVVLGSLLGLEGKGASVYPELAELYGSNACECFSTHYLVLNLPEETKIKHELGRHDTHFLKLA
jgi:hypothetical protein